MSVGRSDTIASPAKTAEPIEMPFGILNRMHGPIREPSIKRVAHWLRSPDKDRDPDHNHHDPLYGSMGDKQRGLYMYTVRFTAAATRAEHLTCLKGHFTGGVKVRVTVKVRKGHYENPSNYGNLQPTPAVVILP